MIWEGIRQNEMKPGSCQYLMGLDMSVLFAALCVGSLWNYNDVDLNRRVTHVGEGIR